MKKSTIKPKNKVHFRQKALLIGDGEINFGDNVNIGYFPSPLFYSTYAHIEARGENSKIFIDGKFYPEAGILRFRLKKTKVHAQRSICQGLFTVENFIGISFNNIKKMIDLGYPITIK